MLQKGFTLIELMIVVAIIGILSMFALPAYQDYTKRTYVSEGMALATGAKLQVTETFSTTGVWPISNTAAQLPAGDLISGQSVASIWVAPGAGAKSAKVTTAATNVTNIMIQYNEKVQGGSSAIAGVAQQPASAPAAAADGYLIIAPVIAASVADQGAVAWACRTKGANIADKWLPANCRAEVAAQS